MFTEKDNFRLTNEEQINLGYSFIDMNKQFLCQKLFEATTEFENLNSTKNQKKIK